MATGGPAIAQEDMYFFKINGNNNADPDSAQQGVDPMEVVIFANQATGTIPTATNPTYIAALVAGNTPPYGTQTANWGWTLNSFGSDYYAEFATPSFSGGGGGGANGVPLAVEGLVLKGRSDFGVNTLTWNTESELNNSHFELMRGRTKDVMSVLSTIPTKAQGGTSNTPLSYEFVDDKPSAKKLYYAVKEVDMNGSSSLSNIVEVTMNDDHFVALDAYPNPTSHTLNVSLNIPANNRLAVDIYDALGRLVYSQVHTATGGNEVLALDVSTLATGHYTLQIRSKTTDFSAISRFVKISE
jgi:hypothetical protein